MREAAEQDFGERRRELATRGRQRCAAVREVDGQVSGVPEGQNVVVPGFRRGGGDRDLVGRGSVGEMLARPSERFQDLVPGTCTRDGADGRCRRWAGLYPDGSRVEPVGNVSGVGDPTTSVAWTSADSSGRQTGDISVCPWISIRPQSARE